MRLISLLFFCLVLAGVPGMAAEPRGNGVRGYYITFMRMPVMDLSDWKASIGPIAEDGVNTLILWMGGAFRSQKYPVTWAYNKEHQNIQKDFVRELIDYAHTKNIRILLGFTPFGYDGVNQYSFEHPELKARKADGSPVDPFGIHCWGWSLCPSKPKCQQFMLDYIREMLFDFYPNADGLLVESSDYNVCRCSDCSGYYYDREFDFVQKISNELWEKKPTATILVYPHYFTGKKVNAGSDIESQSAKKPFDKRWQLFFTPHSAHIDLDLLNNATGGVYSDDSLSLRTPTSIREGAKTSRKHNIGFIPSFEPFSYVPTRDEFGSKAGERISPLGFEWLTDIRRPFTVLPARVQRFAFREYSQNPALTDDEFHQRVGSHFFGSGNMDQPVRDLMFLQECVNLHRQWSSASPLVNPELRWPAERKADYKSRVERLGQIANRYKKPANDTELEMQTIARFISTRWNNHHE